MMQTIKLHADKISLDMRQLTLCGFTSLCMIPCEWQKSRPCIAASLSLCSHPQCSARHMKGEPSKGTIAGSYDVTAPYLQQFIQVIPYVIVSKGRVKNLEICVVHIFKHKTRRP